VRSKFWVWLLLAAATLLIAWNTDIFVPVEHWLVSLAGHPEIRNQFNDPDYGRVDALTLLLSVFVLSPFAALLIIAAFTFALIIAALLIEPVLRTFSLPDWVAVPVVLAGSACGVWAASGFWLPQSLHLLGLVVKAWTVYFGMDRPYPH